MTQSMTAFARAQNQGAWGHAVCELRSTNHRYLETVIRLPETLHEFEAAIRERIHQHIKRGKVECYIRYQPGDITGSEITINMNLAKELCLANETIASLLKNPAPIDTMAILEWPGILTIAEVDLEAIEDEIFQLVETTVQDLVATRAREGEELQRLFLQRLDAMTVEINKVRQCLPDIIAEQRERLHKRFADLTLDVDHSRLEQEMVLFLQKTDVSEELDRIDAHISEVKRVLKGGGVIGRRLDFLMQELNREANTLGAKSVNKETTRSSVELKVLVEQIREQVQNVE